MYKKTFIYKILLAAMLVFCILGYLKFQQHTPQDVSKITAVNNFNAGDLIVFFQNDEPKANSIYVNQVISVTGVIKEISFINERHTILLESRVFNDNFVMCDMSSSTTKTINTFTTGDTVTLKGICKGYLLDVIMLNCIPINEKSNN
jgi:hypothetical protein